MKSDNVKKGMQQAPHRSLFNALGFTEEEMQKPMVGIVSSYNEIVPGHMNLDKIVNAVKLGVAEAAGVTDGFWISLISIASRRFPCPTVPAVSPPFVHELQPYVCICTRYNTS